ncbi:unnamed protein product [Clavelina lepadiformis]|uniref:Palmitoyltransferase n=1 Tax=Clavelina lepadiformis TaxID=159417 RepID=A0ABP0FUJ8_CLALP
MSIFLIIIILFQVQFATMAPLWRILHVGPLTAIFVIFVCYTVSVIDSSLWFMPTSSAGIGGKLNIIILTIWLALILGNFLRAILIGPGYVPKNWAPEEKSDSKYLQFCQVCQGFKPPRAHHCRTCKRCVLKMDHHCPWINNCCGHNNHTNFVLFVLFAPIGCLHAFIVLIGTIWFQLFRRADYLRTAVKPVHFSLNAFFITLFAAGLALGTIIAVSVLLYYQIKIVLTNATGIEQWIIEKAEDRRIERNERPFIYPYGYGRLDNISQVINWQCKPCGNGYKWPVVQGCNQYTLTIEQMKQKILKRNREVPFDVIRAYSGSWFPITHGVSTCCCIPFTDEPRISVKPGDRIIVSRGSKHWIYGNKVLDEKQTKAGKRERGWFPRHCGLKLEEMDDS